MKPSPEVRDARRRLKKMRGRYREVAARSKLGYSWVSKFACGEIGNRPGYDFVQRLLKVLGEMEAEAKGLTAPSMGSAR